MTDTTVLFDDILNQAPGQAVDLMRFCLSDQCNPSLNAVLGSSLSPATYAQDVLRHHYPVLKKRFLKDIPPDQKMTDFITRSYLFENLVATAALYRSVVMRPRRMDDAMEMMSNAAPFLLAVNREEIAETELCGLSNFSTFTEMYVRRNNEFFPDKDVSLLARMATQIGCAEHADWILYDEAWVAVALRRPEWMELFREFLLVVLASYCVHEEQMDGVLGIERADLFECMETFIELRSQSRVSFSDIGEFFYYLSPHFGGGTQNQFFSALLTGPFAQFAEYHSQRFGTFFAKEPQIGLLEQALGRRARPKKSEDDQHLKPAED